MSSIKAEIHALSALLSKYPWLFARLADLLIRDGQPRKAVKLLLDGVQKFPSYVSGHQKMGESLLTSEKSAEALSHFAQARNLAQGLSMAWLSTLEVKRSHTKEHAALLEEALELDFLHAQIHRQAVQTGVILESDHANILIPTAVEADRRKMEYQKSLNASLAEVLEGAPTQSVSSETSSTQSKEREKRLQSDAERLKSLNKPRIVHPVSPPVASGPLMAEKTQVSGKYVHTKRLAEIYLNQGYLDLAEDVLFQLQGAEPSKEFQVLFDDLEQRRAALLESAEDHDS